MVVRLPSPDNDLNVLYPNVEHKMIIKINNNGFLLSFFFFFSDTFVGLSFRYTIIVGYCTVMFDDHSNINGNVFRILFRSVFDKHRVIKMV